MLQINRINKTYNVVQILKDATFSLADGEHAALVGANGSGKTTLFEIIAGGLPADSGTIVTGKNDFIGYLPQNPIAIDAKTKR